MVQVGGGLLVVLADPREGMEAELDRWFEDEHLYERSAIDGFLFSRRYVAIEGDPRSIALYEASTAATIQSEAYLRARQIEDDSRDAENALRAGTSRRLILSPTERMTATRAEYELLASGGRHPGEIGAFVWMVREDVDPEHEADLDAWFTEEHLPAVSAVPGVRGVKRYRATVGTPKYLTLYELAKAEVARGSGWAQAFATPGAERVRPHRRNVATHLGQFFKIVTHDEAVKEMDERLSVYAARV